MTSTAKALEFIKRTAVGIYEQDRQSFKRIAAVLLCLNISGGILGVYHMKLQAKAKEDQNSFISKGEGWSIRHWINLHKLCVAPIMYLLMKQFNAFNNRTYLYLGKLNSFICLAMSLLLCIVIVYT